MAILIDPFAKTVTHWQPVGPFLDALHDSIGCTQVDSMMIQQGMVLWVDNFGLLRSPQRFWRFKDSQFRFAGKVVITAVDGDGMPCDTGPQDLPLIMSRIDWCEGCAVVQIREVLEVTPTDHGPWPRVTRETEFNQPLPETSEIDRPGPFDLAPGQVPVEAPDRPHAPPHAGNGALPPQPAPEPSSLWTVISDDDSDSFIAHETNLRTGAITGTELRFKEMADVTSYFAKADAARLPDTEDQPDEVVARFVTV